MSETITMPDMGDGITSGTIIAQNVKEGSSVNEGDTIMEVETDKAVLPVPAPQNFVAGKAFINEGDEVKVGDILFEIAGASSLNKAPEKKESETTVNNENSKPEIAKTPQALKNKAEETIVLGELGDGITSGTVVSFGVQAGKTVAEGDTLFEIETDKAVLPYPSPLAGKIKQYLIKEGSEVKPGDAVATLASENNAATLASASQTSAPLTKAAPSVKSPVTTAPPPSHAKKTETKPASQLTNSQNTSKKSTNGIFPASPAARKLARELGVNLANVTGSKRGGRIDIFDIKNYVKSSLTSTSAKNVAGSPSTPALPNFSTFGEIENEKLTNLRLTIAKQMEISSRIPHVHQSINVNIHKILQWQKLNAAKFKEAGGSLSVTLFIIKALTACLKQYPKFNSSLNLSSGQLILKKYFNIGVAVDTPAGLIVPVIKNVNNLNIFEIGIALKEIAKKARERKVLPSDLKGACITVSNLGGIGADAFTPIINWPEVAILGVSKTTMVPKLEGENLTEVPILPLTLGYDHRVIDGADAGRFSVTLKNMLENPENMLMGLPT